MPECKLKESVIYFSFLQTVLLLQPKDSQRLSKIKLRSKRKKTMEKCLFSLKKFWLLQFGIFLSFWEHLFYWRPRSAVILTDSPSLPINKCSRAVIYPHLELCCLTEIHQIMRTVPVRAAHTSGAALILPGLLISEEFATRVRGQNSARVAWCTVTDFLM